MVVGWWLRLGWGLVVEDWCNGVAVGTYNLFLLGWGLVGVWWLVGG